MICAKRNRGRSDPRYLMRFQIAACGWPEFLIGRQSQPQLKPARPRLVRATAVPGPMSGPEPFDAARRQQPAHAACVFVAYAPLPEPGSIM